MLGDSTYSVVLLALSLQSQELLFLLPVIPRTDTRHNEDAKEDREAFNPSYNKIS